MADPSVAAWKSFCDRLAAVGERILADDFPGDERSRAEGVRHIANQLACWLTYGLGHADPARPVFFRSADLVYMWGGPNADQVARRAAIDASGTYRVAGTMGSCEDFVLQVKTGAVQTGGADVAAEVYASKIGLKPGDDFSLVVSPDGTADVVLPPDATFVHVRDYYFDWQAREPATFVIERLDDPVTPVPVSAASVAAMLDSTAAQVEHSIVFWMEYQERMRAGQELNVFGTPAYVGRGVQDIMYSHAFVSLAADRALVVELDPSDAELWGAQLYNRVWYEPLDYAHRVASRNHRQVTADPDGHVRLVLCATDPGHPNWLDTEGRDEVLCTIRWFRPPSAPSVVA
ncbi:MAG TPA: DUF1214 domain-containing protein, partial [Mycobacteriales bacterium]|nr:DUF1214 domain-containing protein [Mycobacteriales bacterium]